MEKDLATLIQHHCITHGRTISLAESCTGGNLAARLTRIPGCSEYFLGSIVAYSNGLKIRLLGVQPDMLMQEGAVSGPVVRQMAQGVLKLTGSDYSLAVSGIAGPSGGTPLKPVGTIWGAIGKKGADPIVWDFFLSGSRHEIIEESVNILLARFWSVLLESFPQRL
jgi:PncC family amidohydrolase